MTDNQKLKQIIKAFDGKLINYDSETKSYTARGDHRWDEYVTCKPEKTMKRPFDAQTHRVNGSFYKVSKGRIWMWNDIEWVASSKTLAEIKPHLIRRK